MRGKRLRVQRQFGVSFLILSKVMVVDQSVMKAKLLLLLVAYCVVFFVRLCVVHNGREREREKERERLCEERLNV